MNEVVVQYREKNLAIILDNY